MRQAAATRRSWWTWTMSSPTLRWPPVRGDDRPAIRIAVAAMISPGTTRGILPRPAPNCRGSAWPQDHIPAEENVRRSQPAFSNAKRSIWRSFVPDRTLRARSVRPGAPGGAGGSREKVYHSYIITALDGPIESWDDLRGKRFAFTDPSSNTGCLVHIHCWRCAGRLEILLRRDILHAQSRAPIKAAADAWPTAARWTP